MSQPASSVSDGYSKVDRTEQLVHCIQPLLGDWVLHQLQAHAERGQGAARHSDAPPLRSALLPEACRVRQADAHSCFSPTCCSPLCCSSRACE